MANLQGWHLIIVLVVILLLFGATRLPALARSVGQSTKIFRQEMKDDDAAPSRDASVAQVPSEPVGEKDGHVTTPNRP